MLVCKWFENTLEMEANDGKCEIEKKRRKKDETAMKNKTGQCLPDVIDVGFI